MLQQPSTIKKRPPAKLPLNKMKPNPPSLGKPDNQPDQSVIRATESDLINQAISGSPRTSRKLNNKFLEVNLNSHFVVVVVDVGVVVDSARIVFVVVVPDDSVANFV